MLKSARHLKILTSILIGMMILTACALQVGVSPTPTPTQLPTHTATPEPKKLTICIGQEPETLFLYGSSSRSMWSVLEAIYDGPIDTVNYQPVPVLLQELPTLENGGVTLRTVSVTEGDEVVDTDGNLVALASGVKVFADLCTSPECAVEWDGTSPMSVVQMVVRFKLIDGVKWSDGQPLTAEDSVFSYTVSADPAMQVTKTNLDRTASYTAVDAVTVEWVGQPGYLTLSPSSFFWIPLPKHQLSGTTPGAMIYSDEIATLYPLGWGPYQIANWTVGESITLVKNPNYFRASEGLPDFDILEYKFLNGIPQPDISPVVNGGCDIIDSSVNLSEQIQPLRELELNGKAKAYFGMGPEWEGLNFGIKPASYDDVYNPYTDRPDFFGDVRIRQAFAYCIDREKITRTILYSQSEVPVSYAPPGHPLAASGLISYAHDPAKGIQLLEEVGWLDEDGDPATPRLSSGVTNILNGTEFSLNYYLTESELHERVSQVVVDSLAECGVKVMPTYASIQELYGAGPEGKVFGRAFDLVELAWSAGRQLPCFLYSSFEIPSAANNWLGTKYGGVNFTGYSNADYDRACTAALSPGLNHALLDENSRLTQEILAADLPVLPLFYHVTAAVSRRDLCGLTLDVSSRSALRNIEAFTLSANCPAE